MTERHWAHRDLFSALDSCSFPPVINLKNAWWRSPATQSVVAADAAGVWVAAVLYDVAAKAAQTSRNSWYFSSYLPLLILQTPELQLSNNSEIETNPQPGHFKSTRVYSTFTTPSHSSCALRVRKRRIVTPAIHGVYNLINRKYHGSWCQEFQIFTDMAVRLYSYLLAIQSLALLWSRENDR